MGETNHFPLKIFSFCCVAFALAGCATPDLSHPRQAARDAAQGISAAIAPRSDLFAVTAMRQYRVGPGDELQVTLKGTSNLLGTATVSSGGDANLPRKGVARVVDMTLGEIADVIENDHGAGVDVALRSPAPVYVVGEVKHPGAVTYKKGMTLGVLLADVGGATYKADLRSVFIKPRRAPSETKTDFNAALPILPGDVVRLEERFF